MKSSESIPNFDIKVREYTNYAIKSIKNVCKEFGPRPVGSEAETKAQGYMLADLEKFCDEARREEFVRHCLELFDIHLSVRQHGQPHEAEAQLGDVFT